MWIGFRTGLVGSKRAAEDELNAQQVEIVGADELAIDGFGFIPEPQVDQIFRIGFVRGERVEELTLLEIGKIQIRDLIRISSHHVHQMFGFARRRAIEQHRVKQAEYGDIGADAQADGDRRHQHQQRCSHQAARTIADILGEVFNKVQAVYIATVFFNLFDSAEEAQGGSTSVVGRHARGDIGFDLFLEMKAELGSQLAFHTTLAKQGEKAELEDLGHQFNFQHPLAEGRGSVRA